MCLEDLFDPDDMNEMDKRFEAVVAQMTPVPLRTLRTDWVFDWEVEIADIEWW